MTQPVERTLSSKPLRIGVAVLYVADSRALDATLTSISRSHTTPDRLVVVEQPVLNRTLAVAKLPANAESLKVALWMTARSAALEHLSDCDLVVILREGVVLAPAAITVELERFSIDEELAAALTISRLHLDIGTYVANGDFSDPYGQAFKTNVRRPSFGSRYFSTCMLTLAPKRGRPGSFERMARRSDWAAARFYFDSLSNRTKAVEFSSDIIGFIGNYPDKRESWRQGFDAIEELNRFRAAFPQYSAFVSADIRRIFYEQLYGMIVTPMIKSRAKFLSGAGSAIRAQRKLNARLRRDIADLG